MNFSSGVLGMVLKTSGSIFVVLFLFITMSQGTTLQYMSADELIAEADKVIHGRVLSLDTQWTENMKAIYTSVTLELVETFKGENLGNTCTFTYLGGEIDGVRLIYQNQPQFSKDENVLVFLRTTKGNQNILMALTQGVWRVKQNLKDEIDPVFVRNLRGIQFIRESDGTLDSFKPASADTSFSSSRLRNIVKALNDTAHEDEEVIK